MATLVLTGMDKFTATLRRLAAQAPAFAGTALRREGERIMTDAKRRTPVDTGALRASGHVQGPAFSGSAATVTLGFGGAATPYAVYVHENLRARHVVGEAKFLENALNAARRGMDGRLATDIRARIALEAKP